MARLYGLGRIQIAVAADVSAWSLMMARADR
jgi:hypothetical protein